MKYTKFIISPIYKFVYAINTFAFIILQKIVNKFSKWIVHKLHTFLNKIFHEEENTWKTSARIWSQM